VALRNYLQGEVAQDFADGLLTRREALRRLGLLGLGMTSASALLAACGGGDDDDEAAGTTTSTSPSTSGASTTEESPEQAELIRFAGRSGELQGAWESPAQPKASVLVIHENRGLTPHFHDLVRRLSAEGYAALAVDLLSAEGGTASLTDPAAAPAALSAAPTERLTGDLKAAIDELLRRNRGLKVGAVGFCFGGGMAWRLLHEGETRLAAVVPFYGPAPEAPDFSRAKAAVLGIYAERDARVNESRQRAEDALKAAGLVHQIKTFAGADHAFFNDTGQRYFEPAAREAWTDVLTWFGQHLR
jgi:carboxymethylenebutenolidase